MAQLLQPAITLQRRHAAPARTIKILHLDYLPGESTLLVLRALDDDGIDYDTALAACGIVAGNVWTGFLATRDSGGALVPVVRPVDGILRGDSYFFQLPDADAPERPYPVVVRFSDWCFPHQNLPAPWKDLEPQTAEGGSSCRVTDAGWSVEKAHLVPLSVLPWWIREDMGRYAITDRFSQAYIDAEDNLVALRSDVHKLFDDKVFAIVPKRDVVTIRGEDSGGAQEEGNREHPPALARAEAAAPGLSLVVHSFSPVSDAHFNATYHNRKLLTFRHSVECLFARFAWTIFSPGVLGRFLAQCITERRVLVFDHGRRRFTVETRSREQAYAIYRASQSRSASPRKRTAGEVAGDDEVTVAYWESGDYSGELSQLDKYADEDSPGRGRSRKRRRGGTAAPEVTDF
ncbi:hypothetical protein VTK56DRAFT_854 [Thermocarpiscus australiensis]